MSYNVAKGAITQQEKDRGKGYTPKQKKFLTLLVKNNFKDAKSCAEKAGYKTNHWQLISSMKDDIREISESLLLGATPEAAMTITEIMGSDKPVPNAQAKLSAAKEVLDRSGIVKQEVVNHNVSGGIFILPSKNTVEIEGEYDEA